MAHTPAPWTFEYIGDLTLQQMSERPTVALVGDYRVVRDGRGVRGYDEHSSDREDARLIAVAPEVTQAATALMGELERWVGSYEFGTDKTIHALRVALTKASGAA